jgi:hypothetical protein
MGIAEGVDPSVLGEQVEALSVAGPSHPYDWALEVDSDSRPVDLGVAKRKNFAAFGNHPKTEGAWSGHYGYQGRTRYQGRTWAFDDGRTIDVSVAERQDCPIAGDHPVAEAAGSGRNPYDGLVKAAGGAGPMELSVAKRDDPTIAV